MKLTINKWKIAGTWTWGVSDDECGICSNPYDAACPTCTQPGESCPPVWGKCSHTFHQHCMEKWLDIQPRRICPMCRSTWD